MKRTSTALEANIAEHHTEVGIDPAHMILKEIMSDHYGLINDFQSFLTELNHPYKNWQYILNKAGKYSLGYFYLLRKHPKGENGAGIYLEVFLKGIAEAKSSDAKNDAVYHLLMFLKKIIVESDSDFKRFSYYINKTFGYIANCRIDLFQYFVRSYFPLPKIGEAILGLKDLDDFDATQINRLIISYLEKSYEIWLNKENPWDWFSSRVSGNVDESLFYDISHENFRYLNEKLSQLKVSEDLSSTRTLTILCSMPGNNNIIKHYLVASDKIYRHLKGSTEGNREKILFLLYILSVDDLQLIHEEVLRDVNRTIKWLIKNDDKENLKKVIGKIFSILHKRAVLYPSTALNCVKNIGDGIFRMDDIEFVNFFIDSVINSGFQAPRIKGVSSEWQTESNVYHLKNIRVWMELIRLKPKWASRLLSALIINLTLSGVYIKDTDLFPRDISEFLNAEIKPVYNLVKQLMRLFPSYFSDIGAEGELREISTIIDEIYNRKDILIHYFRKQCHVESSNRIIDLAENILRYWKTGDKSCLEKYIPDDILGAVDPALKYLTGINKIILAIEKRGICVPEQVLGVDLNEIEKIVSGVSGVSDTDKKKVLLTLRLYNMLYQKYNINFIKIKEYVEINSQNAIPQISNLKEALAEEKLSNRIYKLLEYMEHLKGIILSEETFEINENIYYKRHISIDIPSMYGSYHEKKFNSLGLSFRVEDQINIFFEDYIECIDLKIITKATFFEIYKCLNLFVKALKIDGISSKKFSRQMDFLIYALGADNFSFTQYIDIFKGFAQAVKNIINTYYTNIHKFNLEGILSVINHDEMLGKYTSGSENENFEQLKYKVIEKFFREKISTVPVLSKLDLFISRILKRLFRQSNELSQSNLQLILNYEPHKIAVSLQGKKESSLGIVSLGNKGLNLYKLRKIDWPVPPGFIVTTEVHKFHNLIKDYEPIRENFMEQLVYQIETIEKKTGKKFGDQENPLLLSVRSGSSISQPGMMDTFLNVGINENIVRGLEKKTGNKWFAWDCYRRFLQCYGMMYGMDRDSFDSIITELKNENEIIFKREFSGDLMEKLAMMYKAHILHAGIEIIEDAFNQLMFCINKVFRSWNHEKAKTYREILGISDDWGTAVTVQGMVYGNLSRKSGSGVMFTHSPRLSGDNLQLWGDFTIGNQGEDVVSGLVNTLPISDVQKKFEKKNAEKTLESDFPEIYNTLRKLSSTLIYKKGWSPQEIEFTFEGEAGNQLYILQSRDMVVLNTKKSLIFAPYEIIKKENYLANGIGVSGGAMCGRVVFSLEEIDKWREEEPDTSLILIRGDTVPDDIREIHAADGLLTARGGMTSHASVVAYQLEKTCVVGCETLVCDEKNRTCIIGERTLKSGDFISISGAEGSIYHDKLNIVEI